MSERKLSIVVISDLHCHPSGDGINDSYLKTDMLRVPILNHPVESLTELVKNEAEILDTDLVLFPGDFTNKASVQGFISGWDFSIEISEKLNAKDRIATLGNHDVDSYNTFSNYSLKTAMGIKKGFPLKEEDDCEKFWSKGCVFIEREDYRVLVINSSHFHHNKEKSTHGEVDEGLIDYVRKYMSSIKDDKISIALAHHHPIDHSRLDLGENDKIVNGDKLLEILGQFKFDLFVHGHKHDPLLRYHNCHGDSHRIPILSSGSFSSTTNLIFSGQRNTFHRIDMSKSVKGSKGKIKTWSFFPRSGWEIKRDDNGFDSYTGFGFKGDLDSLATSISEIVGDKQLMMWNDIRDREPSVDYLMPNEAKELQKKLENNHIFLQPPISEGPKHISNTKNMKS